MNIKALVLGLAVGLLYIFLPALFGSSLYPTMPFPGWGIPRSIIPFVLLLCPFSLLLFLIESFRQEARETKKKFTFLLASLLFFCGGLAAAYAVFVALIFVALSGSSGFSA